MSVREEKSARIFLLSEMPFFILVLIKKYVKIEIENGQSI